MKFVLIFLFLICLPLFAQTEQKVAEQKPEEIQKELIDLQKELQAQGATSIMSNPDMAKKAFKVFSKTKNTPMSPFANMTEEGIRTLVLKQAEGTPAHQYLIQYPKLITFIFKFLKSEDAFLGLLKIATQDRKLKLYLGTFIFLVLLSFLLNMMIGKNNPFWKRLIKKLFISIFILSLQAVSIYFFFGSELTPTFNIVKEVFF
jgi:hypothetical protein